ncbi:MAG: hypothetical protein EON92_19700 [Burkholderiales bacterium]|nr:MAG: hypothetical protein EON92_19700 [Burkholderiales bacterium]
MRDRPELSAANAFALFFEGNNQPNKDMMDFLRERALAQYVIFFVAFYFPPHSLLATGRKVCPRDGIGIA